MRKKRVFGAFLIIMSLVIMLLPAAEADAESSASDFTIKSGELIKYNGSDKTVSVPDTVTAVGEGAFENNATVEKVILPDSVRSIQAYAFWGCDNLRTVTLGKGLISVDDLAFFNCTGLETMTIPSNIRSIGSQAFAECRNLEDITIPIEVTDIRDNAFDGDYLLNIHCEEGSYADKYAQKFYERQKNMTVFGGDEDEKETDDDKPLNVPADGVYSGADVVGSQTEEPEGGAVLGSTKIVGNRAFVLMQHAALSVRENAGEDNRDQTQQAAAEEPWRIAERSHYRDEALTDAVLEDEVREIGPFAYARSGLKNLVLPDGVEQIDYAAFYHCDDLREVRLPDSVERVASKAFAHTAWVEDFLSGRTANEEDGAADFLISGGVLVAYRGDAAQVTVPDGVRVIAGEAFGGHDEIQKITLPASLQSIDERAFAGCSPGEVEYLGDAMDESYLQELVSLQELGAAAQAQGRPFPFWWIAAAVCMAGGCVCVFQRA